MRSKIEALFVAVSLVAAPLSQAAQEMGSHEALRFRNSPFELKVRVLRDVVILMLRCGDGTSVSHDFARVIEDTVYNAAMNQPPPHINLSPPAACERLRSRYGKDGTIFNGFVH